MPDARWSPIDRFEGYYEVSTAGTVRSLSRVTAYGRRLVGRVLKNMINTHGYLSVNLCVDGKRQTKEVHRLVAETFLPSVDGKPYVNHKDGVTTDASVGNLEWCTQKENLAHSRDVLGTKLGRPRTPMIAYRDGEELRFSGWVEAVNLGFNTGAINAVLNGRHGRHTHGGYKWRYA